MGRHVHYKNGKFNIWSTVIDAYELREWVDEATIIEAFKELAVERAVTEAKEMIAEAKENDGCSVRFGFRCAKEDL